MRARFAAAAGAITLTAAITIPANPAHADSLRNSQWHLKSLEISEAHAISTGKGITVGLIDTGVYPHADLRRNLLAGTSLIPGENGDGRSDKAGHGTNMAALIAAHGSSANNGVLGIAPEAELLPVKFFNDLNRAPSKEMAEGINWAVNGKATVINISVGVGPSFEVQEAVNSAISSNVVIVAAAGNTGSNAVMGYPAAFEGVLAVGATDRSGKHASLSMQDPRIQICAPGVDIVTADPQNKYRKVQGTSAATAIVSGAVALVRAKFPELSAKDAINRITATADDIGPPGQDKECGFGRLNIVKALTADVPPLEGGTASSAASSAAAATTPGTLGPAAAAAGDGSESEEGSKPLIFGVLAGLVVPGALVTLLVMRRRRQS